MNLPLVAISVALFSMDPAGAESPARISFGVPHNELSRPIEGVPSTVYISLPVQITNTSTQPISFGTLLGQCFTQFVCRKKSSNHWTDISAKGMCAVGYSEQRLAPGQSVDATVNVDSRYAGHKYRLELRIMTAAMAANRKPGIRIKSEPVVLR